MWAKTYYVASRGIYVSKSQSLLLKHTLKYWAWILIWIELTW
jgi:hypothetical protein